MPRGEEGGGSVYGYSFSILFSRAEEPEPEGAACVWPLGAGAAPKKIGTGAAKNMLLLYRLLEDKKHREIVLLLL